MNNEKIIQETVAFVKESLACADKAHDWWHVQRVWKLAQNIAREEDNVDMFIVELSALMHDVADTKICGDDEHVGHEKIRTFLLSVNVDSDVIERVLNVIKHVSYREGFGVQSYDSHELHIVQDADRLDAMGAIGIARTFSYGGHKGRTIYDPEIVSQTYMTKEAYKNNVTPSINHFYEKLLLLKEKMHTKNGKKMAQHRHEFMERYLEEFYQEWDGKR